MTQKKFMEINIPIIKERKNILYEICNGVVIEFVYNKDKNNYSLYLNGYEIERNQNYSDYAIKNSFLFIKNNALGFKYTPLVDDYGNKNYAINSNVNLNTDIYKHLIINWDNITIK